jgi:hypothetical protein
VGEDEAVTTVWRAQDTEWFGLLQMCAPSLHLLFLEPADGAGRS